MKIIKNIVIFFVFVLLLAPAFAESVTLNNTTAPEINSPIYSAVVTTPEITKISSGIESKKPYIVSSEKVNSAITNLKVQPEEIFSPVFSEVTNLKVNPVVESDKVIYHLEVPVNTSIYKEGEVIEPIFDLRVNKPVEFKIHDKVIEINNEQIINYTAIVSGVHDKKVMPPLVNIELQSEINSKIYDLRVIPEVNSAVFKFIYKEKEVLMPIYSDFKVENKKLYLINNEEIHDLKVLPPEIYSAIYDLVVKEPKIVIKEISLGIENEKAIYDLRVEHPAKLLWIIPWTVESKYVIDPADGSARIVDKPWYITSESIGQEVIFTVEIAEGRVS